MEQRPDQPGVWPANVSAAARRPIASRYGVERSKRFSHDDRGGASRRTDQADEQSARHRLSLEQNRHVGNRRDGCGCAAISA